MVLIKQSTYQSRDILSIPNQSIDWLPCVMYVYVVFFVWCQFFCQLLLEQILPIFYCWNGSKENQSINQSINQIELILFWKKLFGIITFYSAWSFRPPNPRLPERFPAQRQPQAEPPEHGFRSICQTVSAEQAKSFPSESASLPLTSAFHSRSSAAIHG